MEVTLATSLTWREILDSGITPPVVPAWLGATLGGTLSVPTFGKGSFQHGFLRDHIVSHDGDPRAIDGEGRFGRINTVTLRVISPPTVLSVTKTRTHDLRVLFAHPDAYYVSAFKDGDAWVVVHARPGDQVPSPQTHDTFAETWSLDQFLRGAKADPTQPQPQRRFVRELIGLDGATQVVPIKQEDGFVFAVMTAALPRSPS